ncbi:phosphatase regulator pig2 [Gigaspora margarita]|uniref:Phosphatase regulator pig2 n=1 Tax=Gigaspora margarita TaxID=4874 RepID=A0A8H4AVY3_GIGMA|nr:phosphatase regulator pig2 [Gigaspora margarita]
MSTKSTKSTKSPTSPTFPTSFISQVWFIAKLTFGGVPESNQQDSRSDVSFAYSLANSHLPTPKTTRTNSTTMKNLPRISGRRRSLPTISRRRSVVRDNFLKPVKTVVRKKSGEIVKPSLKDKSNQNIQNTSTFQKVVHFNSNLEQVLSFKKNQMPKAIGFHISKNDSDDS